MRQSGSEELVRALVTGVTGQDGRYLAAALTNRGIEVHGIARGTVGPEDERLSGIVPFPQIHEADLADREALSRIVADVRPDFIYNLGGMSSVAQSWADPSTAARTTGEAATTLLEAAWSLQENQGIEVSFLQASSAEIFGGRSSAPLSEESPISPANPYGAAKAYAHHMASIYRKRGLCVSSCILFSHESPLRPTTFVTRKITAAAARIGRDGAGVVELGDLTVRRDWGWAPDYVEAMTRACEGRFSEDFVVATGEAHSVEEFAEAALRQAGAGDAWRDHVVINPKFVRPSESAVQVGDPTKARSVLGWQPTVAFAEIVARMVDADVRRGESADERQSAP